MTKRVWIEGTKIKSRYGKGREGMFFRETQDPFLSDVAIPMVFFDQMLPIINAQYSKVYLYGYYLSMEEHEKERMDNKMLATKLKMELEEVLEAWDFLESCGLIRKHHSEDGLLWDYAVEFLDIKSTYAHKMKKTASVSTDEMVILAKNNYLRAMFDSIESITKKVLTYNDIRTINEFMKEYSVDKELVIEAFSFSVSIKKSKTVSSALGILRTWYLDGIRNADDLRIHLENKHQRYAEYRKILSFLGEYRLPTGPERKMMDHWLDEMNFGMDVIESAVGKSVAIKNPNMNYVNGVLKNWHKKYTALPNKRALIRANKLTEVEFRTIVIDKLDHQERISQEEDRYLKELYNRFSIQEVEVAIRYLKERSSDSKERDQGRYDVAESGGETLSIEALARFLIRPVSTKGGTAAKEEHRIGAADIQQIIEEKISVSKEAKRKPAVSAEDDELERRLIEKRETINKQAELKKREK